MGGGDGYWQVSRTITFFGIDDGGYVGCDGGVGGGGW